MKCRKERERINPYGGMEGHTAKCNNNNNNNNNNNGWTSHP